MLVLLFVARTWSVHGVHAFLGVDSLHGEMVNAAARLPARSADVMHAAFVRTYAPETASDDGIERSIGPWVLTGILPVRRSSRRDSFARQHSLVKKWPTVPKPLRYAGQPATFAEAGTEF